VQVHHQRHDESSQRDVVDVDHGGQVTLPAQLPDEPYDLARRLRVEAGGRLVHEQDAGTLEERALPTRWRWPPERASARLSTMSVRPTRSRRRNASSMLAAEERRK
jgi:hypothetical protein